MTTLAPLDWREAFKAPTLEEVRQARMLVDLKPRLEELKPTPTEVVVAVDTKELKTPWGRRLLRLASRTVSVASITFLVLSLLDGAVSAFLGIPSGVLTAHAPFSGDSVPAFSNMESLMAPTSGGGGWDILIDKVLWIVDKIMTGVIIFSGLCWMFGNRTKAIEILLGAGVGYVIARHHEEIKAFFQLL